MNDQIPFDRVIRVLEQQFPKELTIAIQQVRIELLQEALAAPSEGTDGGTDA